MSKGSPLVELHVQCRLHFSCEQDLFLVHKKLHQMHAPLQTKNIPLNKYAITVVDIIIKHSSIQDL